MPPKAFVIPKKEMVQIIGRHLQEQGKIDGPGDIVIRMSWGRALVEWTPEEEE